MGLGGSYAPIYQLSLRLSLYYSTGVEQVGAEIFYILVQVILVLIRVLNDK
jgi:hypothetical protein